MKSIFIIILIIFSGLLISCSNTFYHPLKSSIGYWDDKIDGSANIFNIGYKGAEWINESKEEEERVVNFTLLRSAEVAKSYGYDFFIITENKSYREEIFTMNDKCLKDLGNQSSTCNKFKYIGSFTTMNFIEPDNYSMKEGRYKDYNLYDANSIIASITNKYNLNINSYIGDLKSSSGFYVYEPQFERSIKSAIDIADSKPHNPRN